MRWALLLLMAAGCRQVFGLDPPGPMPDADVMVADATRDAQGGSCVERWHAGPQFSAPVPLTELNTASSESSPFLAGSTHLYFVRGADIYVAAASMGTGMFNNPMHVDVLSSMSTEGRAFVIQNQTRAFFSSNRSGSGGATDLFRGFRADANQPWSVDQMFLGNLSLAGDQTNPHLTANLLHIYFGQKGSGIVYAERAGVNDAFEAATEIAELGNGSEDDWPTLTDDESVIVFASRRSGNWELWYATRDMSTPNSSFMPPQLVPAINLPSRRDDAPHLTGDGCTLFFASDRNNGTADDLFVATLLD